MNWKSRLCNGRLYDLVNTAKSTFSASRVVLGGELWRGNVSWRRIGAVNDGLEWVANTLGVIFVDQNSWVHAWGFSRDGLHINRRGRDIYLNCTLQYVVSTAEDK
jgi:hypothetical protein